MVEEGGIEGVSVVDDKIVPDDDPLTVAPGDRDDELMVEDKDEEQADDIDEELITLAHVNVEDAVLFMLVAPELPWLMYKFGKCPGKTGWLDDCWV